MDYHIVVVDDDPVCLEHVRGMLEESNMHAVCLKSGEQLLRYVERHTPDLILLDILMPTLDGFDTYIELRKYEDRTGKTHIPVIYMSGENSCEAEEMGLIFGASDFIVKPVRKEILIRRIENAIKRKKKLDDLIEEATIDKLTGFLNKAHGIDIISKLCKRKAGALAILDLDSFKLVNDLFGHETGDSILRAFAEVVKNNIRETDTVCRIGGDEFMVFFDGLTDERIINSICVKFNKCLEIEAKKIMGDDNGIPLGVSVGVVMVSGKDEDYDALFTMADTALYRVKQNGTRLPFHYAPILFFQYVQVFPEQSLAHWNLHQSLPSR